MKKYIISFIAVLALMSGLTACKMNNETSPESSGTASVVPSVSTTEKDNNGEVTDNDGIIGDEDDRKNSSEPENPVSMAGDAAGDVVSGAGDATEKAGNAVDDVANGIGDAAENAGQAAEDIADGVGDAAKNAGEAANDVAEGVGDAANDVGEGADDAAEGVDSAVTNE